MKASEARFLDFVKKSPQFVIPIYQRSYSWTERECRQLWEDIVRAGTHDSIPAHFIGSIVYIERGLYQVTSQSPLLVIDGQQRLTTLSLLIAALAKKLESLPEHQREPLEGFTPRKLRNYYLVNTEEEGERYHKLILSQTDRETLIAIIKDQELPQEQSLRIHDAFCHFYQWLEKADLSIVCKGIAKLLVVDIALSRDQDNPQLIFESMNSTGKELTQADLIRNYILMGLEHELQTRLYESYWRPMERDFGQEAYTAHFDGFMRHYLTIKTGVIPRIGEVYEQFKKYAQSPPVSSQGIETLLAEIREYAKYFCAVALGAEKDKELHRAFQDIRELKVEVSYPFLLELYDDYNNNVLPKEEYLEALRIVESYVFRRTVCSIPTNSLNKTFAGLAKGLKKDRYIESLKAQLLLLPSYRRFPNDEEFKRKLIMRDLYSFPRRSYWLRRLENYGRKEYVPVDEYTIEHIMPQNPNLPLEWREALGPEWKTIQETYLHTLGNLTLTGYNSEYSDRPFREKRDMEGGFKDSPLKLNEGLGKIETWDKDSIISRAARLSEIALQVWSTPQIEADILEAYKPVAEQRTEYTIEDHKFLVEGSPIHGDRVPRLFEAFRREVLSLDPVVTEEFLKLYVAYKAETNFVDVVPQAKRMRLSLNMPFTAVVDPRGMCEDVSGVGRWGNGDVEVGFSSIDELPYIMGLVRQSFERQMGNGDDST